jgi:APA family basic amino acid/polyamine antiporter
MDSRLGKERNVGVGAVFAVVYATSISSVYFALGVIAHHANGLTPEVFIVAGIFFQLAAMTYVEGASLHPERGGSATFARHAFNELVSFIAGWAIVLDYIILIAVTALTVPDYLAVFWPTLGHGTARVVTAIIVVAAVAIDNVTGIGARRLQWRTLVALIDLAVQAGIVVLGLILVFHPGRLTSSVHLGSAPSVSDLGFALPVAVIAFAGLESAASLAGELSATTKELKRLVGWGSAAIVLVYVGVAVIGVSALPVEHGLTALGQRHVGAPVVGIAEAFHPKALADLLKVLAGLSGALGLLGAADASMLGVSRVGYSLATNRQIPSAVGRLSQRWSTPVVVILFAALAAAALTLPSNIDFLVGIYAFGALVSFAIAHLSVIRMRFREPARTGGYRVAPSIRLGRSRVPVPIPAVIGVILSVAGLVALLIYHHPARYVGLGWMVVGVLLYVAYRKIEHKPLLKRITIPERALHRERSEPDFGSILVPIFGTPLDDDIIQTAGRLAGETRDDVSEKGATIEAIWVFEMPLSLPLDAPLPEARVELARAALKRAREVGEEYEGVEVQTAIVRGRRIGEKIVSEAVRRGVEVIILAAEPPSGIRGGGLMGGSGALENFVGEVTKYVINKAPCRVIVTAPPTDWKERAVRERAAVSDAVPESAPGVDG